MRRLYFAATRYDAAVEGVNFSDEMIYEELKRSYADRRHMMVRHVIANNSLDAFNYFKRNPVPRYGQNKQTVLTRRMVYFFLICAMIFIMVLVMQASRLMKHVQAHALRLPRHCRTLLHTLRHCEPRSGEAIWSCLGGDYSKANAHRNDRLS